MRRISFALMSTLAAVVLLFGYRTSSPHPASVATTTVAAGSAGTPAGSSATPSAPSTTGTSPSTTSTPSSTPSSSTPTTATVSGQAVQTRWGPVQVQLTVTAGKITAVAVLQQPSGNGRDVEINSYALPVLKQETIAAQSAQIDTVSGATVTSDGYLTSLQSALDTAGL